MEFTRPGLAPDTPLLLFLKSHCMRKMCVSKLMLKWNEILHTFCQRSCLVQIIALPVHCRCPFFFQNLSVWFTEYALGDKFRKWTQRFFFHVLRDSFGLKIFFECFYKSFRWVGFNCGDHIWILMGLCGKDLNTFLS